MSQGTNLLTDRRGGLQARPLFTGRMRYVTLIVMVVVFTALILTVVEHVSRASTVVPIDARYDRRTEVRASLIPGAGLGLFAVEPIRKGEVIGELGGRLIVEDAAAVGNHYLVTLAACALERARPHTLLDSRDLGGVVNRINFAPRTINGRETHLQNSVIETLCEPPYAVFVALRDIAPGEEILSSYGEEYDYERFMYQPAVREYFCAEASIDCRAAYRFEP